MSRREQLDDILAAIDELRRRVKFALSDVEGDEAADDADRAGWIAEWRPLKEAAAQMRCSESTLKRHAREWGFGQLVGGKFMVDTKRSRLWCEFGDDSKYPRCDGPTD